MKENESGDKGIIILNLFWLGFLIYTVSYLVSQSERVSYVLCNLLQVMGILLFIPSAVLLMRVRFDNKYLGILFVLYMIWSAGVVVRGINLDYESVKGLLFRPDSGLFLYLGPLILWFPRSPSFIRKIFDVLKIAGVLYLVLGMVFISDLLSDYNGGRNQAMTEYFTQHLSLPVGFLLLTFIYRPARWNWFALFVLFVSFLLAVLRARRGLILMTFSISFFSFIIFQYVNKTRVINIVLSVFLIVILATAAAKIYNDNRKSTFSLITERIGQQTRTEVEQYFYMDMKTKDWAIGKGINGVYFCPGVNEGIGRISIYRRVIETGFLQIILNGGIVSLVLLMLIILPAIVKGLFYSSNILSKGAGMWLILFLVYIYPGTPTIFSMNYLLAWISIGICYSPELRRIREEDLYKLLRRSPWTISEVR